MNIDYLTSLNAQTFRKTGGNKIDYREATNDWLDVASRRLRAKEVAEAVKIPSAQKSADAITKVDASLALKKLMYDNTVDISPTSLVEGCDLDVQKNIS